MDIVNSNELTVLYRAVGLEEYYSIIQTNSFTCHPTGAEVKYFGLDFIETEKFANLIINLDIVAVFRIMIPSSNLKLIGDFTNVDQFLFKKGTVMIHKINLIDFNNAIKSIIQVLWGGIYVKS